MLSLVILVVIGNDSQLTSFFLVTRSFCQWWSFLEPVVFFTTGVFGVTNDYIAIKKWNVVFTANVT